MIFASATQFHVYLLLVWVNTRLSKCLNSVLNELPSRSLLRDCQIFANLCSLFEAPTLRTLYCELQNIGWAGDIAILPSYKISDLNSGRHPGTFPML